MKPTKKHKVNKKHIKDSEGATYLVNNSILSHWCCDCGLRHLVHIEINRGDTEEDDIVRLTWQRDDWGTEARRGLERKAKG